MKHSNFFIHPLTFLLTALLSLPAWQGVMGQNETGHSVTLCADGGVRTFGRNVSCQIGIAPADYNDHHRPENPGIQDAVSTATGEAHSLALLDDGTVLGWGSNGYGALGVNPSGTPYLCSPTSIELEGCAVAISAGRNFSVALLADGTIWAWGRNDFGQLGFGSTTTYETDPQQVTGITNAVAISAGGYHAVALLADGSLKAWGQGTSGQLGDGNSVNNDEPVAVSTANGMGNVLKVDAGDVHNIAWTEDDEVFTWGDNSSGQLGLGDNSLRDEPVESSGLGFWAFEEIVDIAAGRDFSMVLFSNHRIVVVGSYSSGVFGTSGYCATGSTHTPVQGAYIPDAISITAPSSAKHVWAVADDGRLFSWGSNLLGQTGVGSSANRICTPTWVNDPEDPELENYCTAAISPANHPQPCCVAVYDDERVVLED